MRSMEGLIKETIAEIIQQANMVPPTQKKLVGCFPGYVPEELVYAAGMIPVGMWHSDMEVSAALEYFPQFYCGPVLQALEAGIRGECDQYAAVIIAGLCDTLKAAGENWKVAVPQVEFIPIYYPHNRKQDFGRTFLLTEYERIRVRLGQLSGQEITDQRLEQAFCVYNAYRGAMRAFLAQAADHTDLITPLVRHQVVTAGYHWDKGMLLPLLQRLTDAMGRRAPVPHTGKRLLLTGIKLDAPPILAAMERQKLFPAADDLLQESRQLRVDVPMDHRPALERLVERWSQMEGCSLLYDPKKARGQMLLSSCKEAGIDGVVFCLPSFCDPEEYDYPILANLLQEHHIPCLRLEQTSNECAQQMVTRVETFAEILNQ